MKQLKSFPKFINFHIFKILPNQEISELQAGKLYKQLC